ncbi:MAG: thioredoxin [Hyphomicrobiaceae bacterium]
MPSANSFSRVRLARRTFLTGLAAVTAVPSLLLPNTSAAGNAGLSLIMVDEPGCVYCRKWEAEIGGGYARSAQGRFAPLVKVRRKSRELSAFNPVIYTPTFILVRRGEELGRITGYPGRAYFYSELDTLLASAGFIPGVSPPAASGART